MTARTTATEAVDIRYETPGKPLNVVKYRRCNADGKEMRASRRRWFAGGVAAVAAVCVGVANSSTAHAQVSSADWLTIVNSYRTSSGLPAVGEDASLSPGVQNHARYLLLTGSFAHSEDPSNPLSTPDGASAAAASVLGGWRGVRKTDRELIEGWMTAPFHALHFLEPRWQRGAFASASGGVDAVMTSAAVLDVVHGIGPRVLVTEPITFPGNGATVPLTSFLTESPDPLTGCAGYVAPAGLPLIVMFPTAPGVSTSTLTSDSGASLEHCRIDAGYNNPDTNAERTARLLLVQKNAVVIVPRAPLEAGRTYTATVTSQAGSVRWSFTVAQPGGPLPAPSIEPIVLRAAATVKSKVAKK